MPNPPRRAEGTRGNIAGSSLHGVLADVLGTMRDHAAFFPQPVSHTRIAIALSNGDHLELELHSGSSPTPLKAAADHGHADFHPPVGLRAALLSIADLDLGASAKAAAEDLLAQFPSDVKFTSGRRSIAEQASAMAPNVVANRRWIEQTYKASPQRTALQKWVDDHPTATTEAAISAGLEGVMKKWTEAEQRNFSRHITGDAFDVQPVAGDTGEKIKQAIAKLPKLHWHAFSEGGLVIWHAQFEP